MTSDKVTLTLEKRNILGKKVANLRREGQVPGVVYGQGFEPIAVQAEMIPLQKVVRRAGKHHPVQITVDGKKRTALIKSISTDPVKNLLRHVSFHAVKQNEKVTADIPLVLEGVGESPAEKAGLIVLKTLEQLTVKAIPGDLPDALVVSVLELAEAGQRLTVGDVKVPEGVEIDAEADQVIASVYEPSALQAANEAAGGEAEEASAEEVEAENGGEEPAAEKPNEEKKS